MRHDEASVQASRPRHSPLGFWLNGALTVFWLVFLPGWIYLMSQFADRQIMTIGSPERTFFFTFANRLMLAAVLATPVGFWLGSRAGHWVAEKGARLAWLRPLVLFAGWAGLVLTVGVVLWSSFVLGQPGYKPLPPEMQETLSSE